MSKSEKNEADKVERAQKVLRAVTPKGEIICL
jgi:hypothetical protein